VAVRGDGAIYVLPEMASPNTGSRFNPAAQLGALLAAAETAQGGCFVTVRNSNVWGHFI
jgi:hypothetical protein